MMNSLSCKQFVDFLDEYVAGGQSEDARKAFEEHIERCPPCLDFLNQYRDTIKTSRESCCCGNRVVPPEDVPQTLIEAILAARKADNK